MPGSARDWVSLVPLAIAVCVGVGIGWAVFAPSGEARVAPRTDRVGSEDVRSRSVVESHGSLAEEAALRDAVRDEIRAVLGEELAHLRATETGDGGIAPPALAGRDPQAVLEAFGAEHRDQEDFAELLNEQWHGRQNNERLLQAVMSLNLFLEGSYEA